ncbi:MAG: hypothetical protein HYY84_02555 [Deltaproteobacteria bacterium]|nr:hypothetical protein [Deltaproteobacteria bacterium]
MLVAIVLAALTLLPYAETGFTTNDDTRLALVTDPFESGWQAAKSAGRLLHAVGGVIAYVPYLVDDNLYYQTIRLGSLAVSVFLFGFVVFRLFRSFRLGLLAVVFFFAFLTNSWQHNLITSYPFVYSVGICAFLVSLLSFHRFLSKPTWRLGVATGATYLVALFISEIFVLYLIVFFALGLSVRPIEWSPRPRIIYRKLALMVPPVATALLFVVVYFSFRLVYPATYEGIEVAGGGQVDRILSVVWRYSLSAFPGHFPFSGIHDGLVSTSARGGGPFVTLVAELRVVWVVKALLVAVAVAAALKSRARLFVGRPWMGGLSLGAVLIFLPNLLVAMSPKYQRWVAEGSQAYTTTHFSFFAVTLFLAILMIGAVRALESRKALQRLTKGALLSATVLMSLVTDAHNHIVTEDQVRSQAKWRLMDAFIRTPEFKAIADGSVIVAPSLWKFHGIVENHETYWTDYLYRKTGKKILVRSGAQKSEPPRTGATYFLKYEERPVIEDSSISIVRVNDEKGVVEGFTAPQTK